MALTGDGELKRGQIRSDPAWPAYEHMNRRVRRRGAVFFISRGLGIRDWEKLGTQRKQRSIIWPGMSTTARECLRAPDLLPVPTWGATVWFVYLAGARDPNVEPCEKRQYLQSKCATRKKGHFQGTYLATEPGAHWSPWPQGVTCRSNVNRWKEQSLGLAILLMELVYKLPSKHTKVKY